MSEGTIAGAGDGAAASGVGRQLFGQAQIPSWPAALNTELLILGERAAELREAWLKLDAIEAQASVARPMVQTDPNQPRYSVVNGTAVIPVTGVLINRGSYLGEAGITSYPVLARETMRAANDGSIQRIVHVYDTPGGMVAGLDAAEDAMIAAKAKKPLIAVVAGMAASGGYWLASQANEIVLNRRAEVGSIGVYTMHVDLSKLLNDFGINVSLIYSGRHKVDGHPFAPLPDDVRASFQARVDALRVAFARAVGAGRPKLGEAGAMGTEARMYPATDPATGAHVAIEQNLADRIATLEQVLSSPTPGVWAQPKGAAMSQTTDAAPGGTAPGTFTQAQVDAAVAAAVATARTEAHAAGVAEGRTQGATEAATRIASILDHDDAKGREQLARHLAFRTQMPVDDAVKALQASPKQQAATPAPSLADKMRNERQPGTGAPPPNGAAAADPYQRGREIALRAKGKLPAAAAQQ